MGPSPWTPCFRGAQYVLPHLCQNLRSPVIFWVLALHFRSVDPALGNSLVRLELSRDFLLASRRCLSWDCVRVGHRNGAYVIFWVSYSLDRKNSEQGLPVVQWWPLGWSSARVSILITVATPVYILQSGKSGGRHPLASPHTASTQDAHLPRLRTPHHISGCSPGVPTPTSHESSATSMDYSNQCSLFSTIDNYSCSIHWLVA